MYSTYPNGVTLHTEKSQTFKNDCNPFLSFVFHNNWLQNHCWLSLKIIVTDFVVVVGVSQSSCYHIGSGMPYLCIFVGEIVTLSGAITDK